MFLEALLGEIRVTFQDVDDDRSPGDNVALLSLVVEDDEGADDVGA